MTNTWQNETIENADVIQNNDVIMSKNVFLNFLKQFYFPKKFEECSIGKQNLKRKGAENIPQTWGAPKSPGWIGINWHKNLTWIPTRPKGINFRHFRKFHKNFVGETSKITQFAKIKSVFKFRKRIFAGLWSSDLEGISLVTTYILFTKEYE